MTLAELWQWGKSVGITFNAPPLQIPLSKDRSVIWVEFVHEDQALKVQKEFQGGSWPSHCPDFLWAKEAIEALICPVLPDVIVEE